MSLPGFYGDPDWSDSQRALSVIGLFAGIGGIEQGLSKSGFNCQLLCELDDGAQSVLRARFPNVPLVPDVRDLGPLPAADVVTAGFPCQDLSQAGRTAGINGSQSGLIDWVFRAIRESSQRPTWILLENVPFMLQLQRGAAMRHLVDQLESLNYRWAYRTIDTRAFGIPQRRRRVMILATSTEDPRSVLLSDEAGPPPENNQDGVASGFYWTEGNRGLGWAVNAVPPLKGSSSVGIPVPPAIWLPDTREIVTPEIRDAERLQGFPADWTKPALSSSGRSARQIRWRLVGNAVSVPVAEWVGYRMINPVSYDQRDDHLLLTSQSWPSAAWGGAGEMYAASRSAWPVQREQTSLADFLQHTTHPLSARAASGFLHRLRRSRLRVPDQFPHDLEYHVDQMNAEASE